eukprot:scaffold104193_cov63-Phaeocystis_antarctica.AAC.3
MAAAVTLGTDGVPSGWGVRVRANAVAQWRRGRLGGAITSGGNVLPTVVAAPEQGGGRRPQGCAWMVKRV